MKVHNLVVSMLIIYFVVDTNCGVIDNVYGSIKNRTEAFKEGVSSYWSGAKDYVFGDDSEKNTEGAASEKPANMPPEQNEGGIISGIYGQVSNAFQSARQKVHDVILGSSHENKENTGVVSSMYEKVKNRITQVKSFITGGDTAIESHKPSEGIKPIQDAVTKFLEGQMKRNNEALETVRHRVVVIDDKVREATDSVKQDINKLKEEESDNINKVLNNANEMTRSGITEAKVDLSSSFDNFNTADLTEKEKEILNAISRSIRSRMSNVLLYDRIRHSGGNQTQLSYATEEVKN